MLAEIIELHSVNNKQTKYLHVSNSYVYSSNEYVINYRPFYNRCKCDYFLKLY
jgi:hypothetical protein